MSHDRGCFKCGRDVWQYARCKEANCVKDRRRPMTHEVPCMPIMRIGDIGKVSSTYAELKDYVMKARMVAAGAGGANSVLDVSVSGTYQSRINPELVEVIRPMAVTYYMDRARACLLQIQGFGVAIDESELADEAGNVLR